MTKGNRKKKKEELVRLMEKEKKSKRRQNFTFKDLKSCQNENQTTPKKKKWRVGSSKRLIESLKKNRH